MLWSIGQVIGIAAAVVATAAAMALVLPRPWRDATPYGTANWRWSARHGALISGIVAWALAPFWAVGDGLERFDRHPDPVVGYIAGVAYRTAWMRNDNPIERVLMPAVRVQRVWRDPDHCPANEPGGREPYADWRAEARYYTYFGIPAPRLLQVSCGGWSW